MAAAGALGWLQSQKLSSSTGLHRLMSRADARSFHMSALSTAHALMHLTNRVLGEAARAAAGTDAAASCSQEVAHAMDTLEERMWDLAAFTHPASQQ
jgi:hypothetical protein